MINYERLAKGLAVVHHHGQFRVNGEEYIEHVIRVARSFSPGSRERQVAYLHDLVEDTSISMHDLGMSGYCFHADVRDVLYLTRVAGYTYAEYIDRLIRNGSMSALSVKLADLEDNMRDLPPSLASQADRYAKARSRVQEEIWRRGKAGGETPMPTVADR